MKKTIKKINPLTKLRKENKDLLYKLNQLNADIENDNRMFKKIRNALGINYGDDIVEAIYNSFGWIKHNEGTHRAESMQIDNLNQIIEALINPEVVIKRHENQPPRMY